MVRVSTPTLVRLCFVLCWRRAHLQIATLGILVAPRALEILLHDLGFVLFPLGLIIIAISAGNLGFKNLSPFPVRGGGNCWRALCGWMDGWMD